MIGEGDTGGPVRSVEDLALFRLVHAITLRVYSATRQFPRDERFGLTSQVRRSAASVPANLSEGAARIGKAEYRRFAGIARGSLAETKYHLLLAKDLGYLDQDRFEKLRNDCNRAAKMLTSLIRSLS